MTSRRVRVGASGAPSRTLSAARTTNREHKNSLPCLRNACCGRVLGRHAGAGRGSRGTRHGAGHRSVRARPRLRAALVRACWQRAHETNASRLCSAFTFARFAISEKLGEGTYGVVYLARDTAFPPLSPVPAGYSGPARHDEGVVALKKMRLDAHDEGVPVTTLREVALLKDLEHANIVRLREVSFHASQPPPSPFLRTDARRCGLRDPSETAGVFLLVCVGDESEAPPGALGPWMARQLGAERLGGPPCPSLGARACLALLPCLLPFLLPGRRRQLLRLCPRAPVLLPVPCRPHM